MTPEQLEKEADSIERVVKDAEEEGILAVDAVKNFVNCFSEEDFRAIVHVLMGRKIEGLKELLGEDKNQPQPAAQQVAAITSTGVSAKPAKADALAVTLPATPASSTATTPPPSSPPPSSPTSAPATAATATVATPTPPAPTAAPPAAPTPPPSGPLQPEELANVLKFLIPPLVAGLKGRTSSPEDAVDFSRAAIFGSDNNCMVRAAFWHTDEFWAAIEHALNKQLKVHLSVQQRSAGYRALLAASVRRLPATI